METNTRKTEALRSADKSVTLEEHWKAFALYIELDPETPEPTRSIYFAGATAALELIDNGIPLEVLVLELKFELIERNRVGV